MRATLGLVEKLASDPDAITPDDIDRVRSTGMSDEAIEDAIAVSSTFHIIDRLADAFAFDVPDEAGFEATVRILLRTGYTFPPPVWWFGKD